MTETTLLAAYGLLVMLTILLQVLGATRQLSMGYLMSSRDETRTTTGMTARLGRAVDNSVVAMALFAPAVLLIEIMGRNNSATLLAAQV
ncbi:MAG: MAPEG family protein, partial [Sulfitobacter dubius]